ncbi:MAG: exopolysaccharide Pel transporter PelG [Verrucomicrobiota bacterium]
MPSVTSPKPNINRYRVDSAFLPDLAIVFTALFITVLFTVGGPSEISTAAAILATLVTVIFCLGTGSWRSHIVGRQTSGETGFPPTPIFFVLFIATTAMALVCIGTLAFLKPGRLIDAFSITAFMVNLIALLYWIQHVIERKRLLSALFLLSLTAIFSTCMIYTHSFLRPIIYIELSSIIIVLLLLTLCGLSPVRPSYIAKKIDDAGFLFKSPIRFNFPVWIAIGYFAPSWILWSFTGEALVVSNITPMIAVLALIPALLIDHNCHHHIIRPAREKFETVADADLASLDDLRIERAKVAKAIHRTVFRVFGCQLIFSIGLFVLADGLAAIPFREISHPIGFRTFAIGLLVFAPFVSYMRCLLLLNEYRFGVITGTVFALTSALASAGLLFIDENWGGLAIALASGAGLLLAWFPLRRRLRDYTYHHFHQEVDAGELAEAG